MASDCHLKTLSLRRFTKYCSAGLLVAALSGCGGSSGTATTPNSNTQSAPQISTASSNYSAKSIVLSWNVPTTRANGDPLSPAEIGGYEIVYLTSNNRPQNITVENPLATSYTIASVNPDSYRFFIFSYDSDNRVSPASPEIALPLSSFANL